MKTNEEKLIKTAMIIGFMVVLIAILVLIRVNSLKNEYRFSGVGEPGEFDEIVDIVFINSTNPESINDAKLFHFNNKTKELREIEAVVMINNLPETG